MPPHEFNIATIHLAEKSPATRFRIFGGHAFGRCSVLFLLVFTVLTDRAFTQESLDKAAIPRPGAARMKREAEARAAREKARRLTIEAAIAEAEGRKMDLEAEADALEEGEEETPDAAEEAVAGAIPPELAQMLPVGAEFEGVRFPNYSGDRLTSVVNAEKMSRLDSEHLDLIDLVIDVLNDVGEIDTKIYMDRAVYDLTERKLTSRTDATIEQKPKFVMTGDKLIFEAATEKGHMIGNVVMQIFGVKKTAAGGILPGTSPKASEEE